MQSTNQKVNTFQSVLGVFLHSCRTPEKVIETLARMGVSVSTSTIHNAIKSLSVNARRTLQQVGRTLCAGIAYDNVDILIKAYVPTVEKSAENLKHLTSGLFFPLMHNVTCEDLKCSKELWVKSPYNPVNLGVQLDKKTYFDLVVLLMEDVDEASMTSRDHFVAWLFLRDLCTYGPLYFQQFLTNISQPTAIEAIPVVKTDILPAYTMEVNNSTVSGNIQAIDNLLEQGGILNPLEIADNDYNPDFDVSDYIVLVHGDLGTGERIQSIHQRRSIEETAYERKQMVFFCPGLFHCKMACADSLHRILVKPAGANKDNCCLMNDAKVLHPRETHILETKPTFRHMHRLINHAGICRRLNCWRVLVEKMNTAHTSLDSFVQMYPTLDTLRKMANRLALEYTNCEELSLDRLKTSDERDGVFENSKLTLKYLALYEELSWAMNYGDIGRVERCLLAWIPVFKGSGKHKYATHLERFLTNVHFDLPVAARRAVRYNWLVNVTGKPGKFRALDWCVELQNLEIKVRWCAQEHGILTSIG
jgi:hypothetical protein